MSHLEIGLIGLAILSFFLLIGIDVGFSMLLTGLIGYALIGGWQASLSNIAIIAYDRLTEYSFSALPLFLLMGTFVSQGGIGKEAYQTARSWIGHSKGGLAIATIGGCALFAAISGTTLAGSLVMGKVSYPEMRRAGYKMPLAAGVVSVGGTLGILIPPSMGFIIIGITAGLSIGQLFMAGIIPGILVALFYILTVVVWCKIDPKVGPAGPRTTWKQKFSSLKDIWPVIILFLFIMGGLYGGVFTAVEAGAVGAFGALIIPVAMRKMTWKAFWYSLKDTAKMTAMIIVLMVGAYLFNAFLAITQIPNIFGEFLVNLAVNRWIILMGILVFYILAGTFFDPIAILILTIPIFYPAVHALGFDLLWWSVLMVRLLEIGQISPPAGINLFGLKGVIDAPMTEIYKGVVPFLMSDALNLVLLCLLPVLSTFIPYHMFG